MGGSLRAQGTPRAMHSQLQKAQNDFVFVAPGNEPYDSLDVDNDKDD